MAVHVRFGSHVVCYFGEGPGRDRANEISVGSRRSRRVAIGMTSVVIAIAGSVIPGSARASDTPVYNPPPTDSGLPYPVPTEASSGTTSTTSMSLQSSLNPSTFGDSVRFTAQVVVVYDAHTSTEGPTGTVQFTVDGSDVGSPTFVGGLMLTSINLSTLTGGVHTVTATYSGDGTYARSSASVTQTVERAKTQLTTTPAIASVPAQQVEALALSAKLTTAGHPLSHQLVKFWAGKTAVCSATTGADGVATCSGTSKAIGIVVAQGYTATYGGTVNYLPSSAKGSLVAT